MATAMVNGAANADSNTINSPISNAGKQQSKAPFGNKAGDGGRKPTGTPGDGTQRKNLPQKAWQSGMNPITQRSTTPAGQNGAITTSKPGSQKAPFHAELSTADKHSNDRLLYLMAHFLGLSASITVKNGDVFSGIFFGSLSEGNESSYLLKMVQKVKSNDRTEANGNKDAFEDYIGAGEDHAMSFDSRDIVDLAVDGVTFDIGDKAQNGISTGFRTDADISGHTVLRERTLQRWEPSSETDVELSLEATGGSWDQFQANEQRFGLKSDYDENIYTTSIDKSHPDYRRREADASRIAREIEGGQAENPHVREERGATYPDDGLDEEEKYSGVRRQAMDYPPLQSQNNRYMPPGRRPPTGKPTVPGAPVDPAIISLQMAGTGTESRETQPATKQAENESAVGVTKVEPNPESNRPTSKPVSSNKDTANNDSRTTVPAKQSKGGESAMVNVEHNLLDSFRQFASSEKMKLHDQRRQRVSQDKAIKLNDLMKFSQNFKLLTPVPKDLVPILAKDKSKQEEIIEKAQRNVQSSSTLPQALTTTAPEAKATRPAVEAKHEASRPAIPPQGPQAAQSTRDRQQLYNGSFASSKASQGLLGHRLADTHRQHKVGLQPVNIPQALPIQSVSRPRASVNTSQVPQSQSSSTVRTPTSAVSAKFNGGAKEFRPNPAANAFRPNGEPSATSSPNRSTPHIKPPARPLSPSDFFGTKRPPPRAARQTISENFNPLKRLRARAQEEGKEHKENGGIRYAYTTPPTWNNPQANEDFKSYKQMFEEAIPVPNRASPQHGSPGHPPLPHQHQLPLHLQHNSHGVPHLPNPQQMPFPAHPQPLQYALGPHYDEHRMHLSASSSSVYPSPRMHNPTMAYPSPMPQTAQLAYGQAIPQYVMAPSGPQAGHYARQFTGGPQMIPAQGPHFVAPMMAHQSSQGGFVAPPHSVGLPIHPQVQMFPPGQPSGYSAQSQPTSGYPSPGRGAPMMMHQGSHQGQHSQTYMNPGPYGQPIYAQQPPPHMMPVRAYGSPQPHYSQSPQQQYHYPHQQGRAQSSTYGGQPPLGPHQHLPAQQAPPNGTIDGGEEMK